MKFFLFIVDLVEAARRAELYFSVLRFCLMQIAFHD
jgi:hypothetical protein